MRTRKQLSEIAERAEHPSTEECYNALDQYREEAIAGIPDEEIARKANVTKNRVRDWRRHNNIKHSRTPKEAVAWACDVFGQPENCIQQVAGVAGRWEPPQYVLRTPLDYSKLCRALWYLNQHLGMDTSSCAAALGLREKDVDLAISTEGAHLLRVGRKCPNCDRYFDPQFGSFCSTQCKK